MTDNQFRNETPQAARREIVRGQHSPSTIRDHTALVDPPKQGRFKRYGPELVALPLTHGPWSGTQPEPGVEPFIDGSACASHGPSSSPIGAYTPNSDPPKTTSADPTHCDGSPGEPVTGVSSSTKARLALSQSDDDRIGSLVRSGLRRI
jgi:hypothetical protein